MVGPLESWPSFRDISSREEAEALVGDHEKMFVVRKKSDERENPHVFVLTFKTNTMMSIIMFRDPNTGTQYHGVPTAEFPNPPLFPSVLLFLAE
jgi:hypothetical protein